MRCRRIPHGAVVAAILLAAVPVRADEIGTALDASQQAVRAARESQARIDKLDDETRALREKRRDTEWRALQQAAYAEQLEQEAVAEEGKRAGLEAQLARIAGTEKELLPLMQRMVAELDEFVAADLPFLRETRRQRVADLKALLADPARTAAEKYRRVLDAYRSEVDYGHSVGAEEATIAVDGATKNVSLVHVGRVGLYYLEAGGASVGAWDAAAGRWREIDGDFREDVQRALDLARNQAPPELVVLPVQVAR